MAIAEKKRKRKAELRNKTIPSPEAIANAKKQQDFLAKAHAAKREEIEARLDEKENFMNQSAEEWSKNMKNVLNVIRNLLSNDCITKRLSSNVLQKLKELKQLKLRKKLVKQLSMLK